MHNVLNTITALGDQSVILPFIMTVAVVLALIDEWNTAAIWCAALFGVLFAMLVTKMIFIPCGYLMPQLGLRSPSGHAASAVAAYGSFAVLWIKRIRPPGLQILTLIVSLVIGLGIAATRFLLGAHNLPEIAFGVLIGLSAPLILHLSLAQQPRPLRTEAAPLLLLLVVPVVLVVALPAFKLDIERRITHLAFNAADWLNVCQGGWRGSI